MAPPALPRCHNVLSQAAHLAQGLPHRAANATDLGAPKLAVLSSGDLRAMQKTTARGASAGRHAVQDRGLRRACLAFTTVQLCRFQILRLFVLCHAPEGSGRGGTQADGACLPTLSQASTCRTPQPQVTSVAANHHAALPLPQTCWWPGLRPQSSLR